MPNVNIDGSYKGRQARRKTCTAIGYSRAILVVALLIGSTFPAVAGINVSLIAAIIVVPLVGLEMVRGLPYLHPIVVFFGPLFVAFAIHVLIVGTSTDYGEDKIFRLFTSTLASGFAAVLVRNREDLRKLAISWLVAGVILSIATVLSYSGAGRATTFDTNPIWLSRALASAALMAIYLWWRSHLGARWAVVFVSLLVAGMFMSGSRGPLIGLVVGVAIVVLFSREIRAGHVVSVAVGVVVSVVALRTLEIFDSSRLNRIGGVSDDTARMEYWRASFSIIADNPAGVGVGNWMIHAGLPRHEWPHNIFLEVFAEFGWAVGVVFVATVLAAVTLLIRAASRESSSVLVLALLSSDVVSVSVSGDLNARTFFFLLGLAFTVCTAWGRGGARPQAKRPKL